MDTLQEVDPEVESLPHDGTVSYEEQIAPLASRISNAKLHLLSDTKKGAVSSGKRKRDYEFEDEEENTNDESPDDPSLRRNALLFRGTPIESLHTTRLFAYATHFDAHPLGIEWIDDSSAVFVFPTPNAARAALLALSKPSTDTFVSKEDNEMYYIARSIPVELWPPDKRVVTSLVGEAGDTAAGLGLRGAIHLRWARTTDVKRMRAGQSGFYRNYGKDGKGGTAKRHRGLQDLDVGSISRRHGVEDDETLRQALDDELDAFLADDTDGDLPEQRAGVSLSADVFDVPLSRMRSDFIAEDGRSILKTAEMAENGSPILLLDRMAPTSVKSSERVERWEKSTLMPRERTNRRRDSHKEDGSRRDRNKRGSARSSQHQNKTQAELDDELDAFLNSR